MKRRTARKKLTEADFDRAADAALERSNRTDRRALGRGMAALMSQPPEKTRRRPGSKFQAKYSRLSISISPQVRKALEEMLGSGLFGLTLAGVAEEMVRAGVRDAILKSWARPPRGLVERDGKLVLPDVTR